MMDLGPPRWIDASERKRKDGKKSRPQLFDEQLAPKPVYPAALETLNAAAPCTSSFTIQP